MLGVALQHGTTDIVATPHASMRYRFQPEIVRERVHALTCGSGAPKPRIHWGCDFHLSFDNVEDALREPTRYTINGGRYLLVEFPDHSIAGMGAVLEMFLQRGLIPILTHPERNPHLRAIPREFQDWIARGCLAQITAQSLLGRFGKHAEESGWEMLQRNLAHFLASDAHDTQDRTPRLDQAFEAVRKRFGKEEAARLMIKNPGAVIANGRVERRRTLRRWFQWNWNHTR